MVRGNFHEEIWQEEVRQSPDRSFGIVFAVVFVIIALWPLADDGVVHIWSMILAMLLLAIAIIRPALLAPLNRVWTAFGTVLHRITNPLIMGIIFLGAVTPTALIIRALGKDPLRRRFDRNAKSYWIDREPPGPEPASMKRQF